nr:hypothetical protein [Candidatus Omnitrophota bacterium]
MSHVSHFRVPLKMISAVVAGIFLFQEIVWAGDIVSLIQPASEPAPNSSSVEVIQSGQTQAETLIEAKNAIEDFSLQVSPGEATLSTSHGIEYDREVAGTTGWTFYYRSDVLVEKSHEDGRAYVYSYDEAGRISAFDYYKAGDVFYYTQEYDRDANGNVTAAKRVFLNGNTYHYTPNWKVTRIDYADGRALTYTYDAEWKVTGRVMYYAPGGV